MPRQYRSTLRHTDSPFSNFCLIQKYPYAPHSLIFLTSTPDCSMPLSSIDSLPFRSIDNVPLLPIYSVINDDIIISPIICVSIVFSIDQRPQGGAKPLTCCRCPVLSVHTTGAAGPRAVPIELSQPSREFLEAVGKNILEYVVGEDNFDCPNYLQD